MPATRWFAFPEPNPKAPFRLFCLPYAGGGSAVFHNWPQYLQGVEVVAVRLPGRESRFREVPYKRIDDLVADLVPALRAQLDRPYALFGHSMGARVAYEVARRLRAEGAAQPISLFVSGSRAPHLALRPSSHDLPDREFLEFVRELGGAPPEFFHSPELIDLMLPVLRADFTLVDSYVHRKAEPFDFPIKGFCGSDDHEAPFDDAIAWREHTTDDFAMRSFPGDHFFLTGHLAEILALVQEDIFTTVPVVA